MEFVEVLVCVELHQPVLPAGYHFAKGNDAGEG
jgi:hypothetical protein